ncbi:MAG: acylneuraminate cytidylyltransferase family protein [Mucilaginibacter polytrichastri]|nr:acylneuraminate cytidylyltransferase family protein [Mucilaginibacter polytrichastri]
MLAIIPARGGSKRLKGKNVKMLDGKPMIEHTIRAAQGAKEITQIVVSTDSEEIAGIAKACGAWVPFLRPSFLAGDDAKSRDVFIYTLDVLASEYNIKTESVAILQPTSPLRTAVDIDRAVFLFKQKSADSVISYTAQKKPPEWGMFLNNDGTFRPAFDKNGLPDLYYPNGAIYIFDSGFLRANESYYSPRSFAYVMNPDDSVDIDDEDDFHYAEYLLKRRRESGND